MIAERSVAQAAHAWGAHGIPFNDEPKSPQIDDQKRDKKTRRSQNLSPAPTPERFGFLSR
jgi:hypothetical protein